jgi:hypothetical protein
MWSGIYARDPHRTIEEQITGYTKALVYDSERHFTDVQDDQTMTTCTNAILPTIHHPTT